jgi:hypothetical protein
MTTLCLLEYQQTQKQSNQRSLSLRDILLRDNEEDKIPSTSL